jgi:catechol 2,3-dioxygenase-like lactoylglutathione lyase family enzyme
MSLIEGIETVYYQTANMEESVRFYTEVLGLALKNRHGIDWAEYDIGGIDLAIAGELARKPEQGGATVVFRSSDVEGLRDALQAAGAKFDPIDATGGAKMLNFEDPDKNKLMAVEPL